MDQALARTGGGKRDQGEHAAQAVLAMAELRETTGNWQGASRRTRF
jgi:6,7-dimethyl-8-ribityllumazine synthase